MFDIPTIFAGLGAIILLGYVSNCFFRKTGIPDIIWLLLLGIILGPVSHLVNYKILIDYAPFFASLATVIILFEGGIQTDLILLIKQFKLSVALAIANVLFSIFLLSFLMNYYFNWPYLYGALLGAMIGGISSPIVIPITRNLKLDEKTRTILNLEATLTDVLCFVIVMALISMIIQGNTSFEVVLNKILGNFSIGAVVGFISGVFWLSIIKNLKGKFKYIATLGFTFLIYSFVEKIMASGAIAVLTMGIVLGNSYQILKILESEKVFVIDKKIKDFHEEITFLVKSFFFVYLGMIVNFQNITFLYFAAFLTLTLFTLRFLISSIIIPKTFSQYDKNVIKILMARGLAAAVLAQFPSFYNLQYSSWFINIVFGVIIFSVFVSSIGLIFIKK